MEETLGIIGPSSEDFCGSPLLACTVSTLSAVSVSAKPEILMKFRMNENDYFS